MQINHYSHSLQPIQCYLPLSALLLQLLDLLLALHLLLVHKQLVDFFQAHHHTYINHHLVAIHIQSF